MIEPALAAARRSPSRAIQPRLQATVSALGDAQARGRIVVLGPGEGRRAVPRPGGGAPVHRLQREGDALPLAIPDDLVHLDGGENARAGESRPLGRLGVGRRLGFGIRSPTGRSGTNVPDSSKEGWGDRGRASDGPVDRRAASSTLVARHVPRPKRVGMRSALKRSGDLLAMSFPPPSSRRCVLAPAPSLARGVRAAPRRRRRSSPSSVTAPSPPRSASAAIHTRRVPFPAGCSSRSAARTVVRRVVTEFPAAR